MTTLGLSGASKAAGGRKVKAAAAEAEVQKAEAGLDPEKARGVLTQPMMDLTSLLMTLPLKEKEKENPKANLKVEKAREKASSRAKVRANPLPMPLEMPFYHSLLHLLPHLSSHLLLIQTL